MNKLISFLLCATLLWSCGNDNSESIAIEEIEKDNVTFIDGDTPPVTNFYEVNMASDGKTPESLSDNTFKITVDHDLYWAEWKYGNEEDFEEIKAITEIEAGAIYDLETMGAEGIASFTITKVNEDGIWLMTNSRNDHKGYLCDTDAAINFEDNQNNGNADDTPKQIIASIGQQWIALTEQDGDWIIYNECRYGSGGLNFDEGGEWLEFSGGGDAHSSEIVEMKRIDYNKIKIKYGDQSFGDSNREDILTITGEDIIILNEGTENEEAFILGASMHLVETVDEECDEEDM